MNLDTAKNELYSAWYDRTKEFPWLATNTMLLTIHGSTAYGLNTITSDVDLTGICVPPKEFFLGFMNSMEQIQFNKPDGAVYNIQKFCRLAADNNPNVMELLWIDPKYWVRYDNAFIKLRNNRDLFLSSKVKHTYSGYAVSQLNRIRLHKRWLLNPAEHKPTREEFGLASEKLLSNDQRGALNALIDKGEASLSDNFMEELRKENAYQRTMQEYHQYQNWKTTRNPARAELEAKFGLDTKHAAHLVRLMRQCRSLLERGELEVERSDRAELLAIRNGAWNYDQLIEFAEREDKELEQLYLTTKLPKRPNREAIDKLCVEIVEEFIK